MKRPPQELVDAFFAWYLGASHAQNEDCYIDQVTGEALRSLTREQFIEFFFEFARDGGKVQSGGQRNAPNFRKTIEARYKDFREFVLEPFAEGFDELKWFERTTEFLSFGQGLASIYLNRVDKKRYPIVNEKAVESMSLFDVQVPDTPREKRFASVRDAERQLIDWFPALDNFYRADALNQFLIGEKVGQRWKNELRGKMDQSVSTLIEEAPGDVLFGKRAFELLSALHKHPLQTFYEEHGEEFDATIEAPLKRLMRNLASALPASMTDALETQKRLFSRIQKNDYGRGGAWDFYWGAFYPKGGKRTADAQLFVFISSNVLRFGFYIGDYGTDPRNTFAKNCAEHGAALRKLLQPALEGTDLVFGEPAESVVPSWSDWLTEPERFGFAAAIELKPDAVVSMPEAMVTADVAKTFERLFPLVLLAQHDAPLDPIRRYLGAEPSVSEEKNPVFSLDQVAIEAHMERGAVDQWARAIKRKKQVILYGPPGTGKTYLAQLLAKHVVGGGDGFCDVLQFHPSYAYEDFIQGLRPKSLKGGGLEFGMVPGRFKEFCARATECTGLCVVVIDEINRANLARVFGELMYLLEYRTEAVPLAGGERFEIPSNVVIIGTMNTADRSIALVDHALRRRFAFLALYPNYDVLRKYHAGSGFNPEGLIGVLERLNAAINDRHYSVGVSFFLDREIKEKLQDVWQMEIEPYIEELFFDQQEKAKSFAWEKVRDEVSGT